MRRMASRASATGLTPPNLLPIEKGIELRPPSLAKRGEGGSSNRWAAPTVFVSITGKMPVPSHSAWPPSGGGSPALSRLPAGAPFAPVFNQVLGLSPQNRFANLKAGTLPSQD
jgi:hypothetical protein